MAKNETKNETPLFGRRGAPRPDAPAAARQPSVVTPGGPGGLSWPEILRSRLARQIGGILAGIALLIAVKALWAFFMIEAGHSLARRWDTAGYPGIERALSRMSKPTESVNRAHAACFAETAGVKLSRAQRDALLALPDIWVGEERLERFARYVECLAWRTPARFCQAADKEHLQLALADYFALQTAVREEWVMSLGGPMGAEKAVLTGVATVNRGDFPSGRTDRQLVASIKAQIENGYIRIDDLGRIGSGLELRDVTVRRKACT